MGDTAKTAETAQKKSWFKGIKAEFKKIIWPDKKTLVKQTIAVFSISVFLCIIITVADFIIKTGLNFII